jgi:choline-sulfatase
MALGSILRLWLAAAVALCSCSGEPRSLEPGCRLDLFDCLEAARFEGLARSLLEDPPAPRVETLLSVDFEDGTLGGLAPFGGFGVDASAVMERVAVVPDHARGGGATSVRLRGPADHGVSLRTAPIRVYPARTYELSYRVSSRGIPRQGNVEHGGASVLLYRLGADQFDRAAEVLADPELERRARLRAGPDSFSVPAADPSGRWTRVSDRFWVDQIATHMVISFDLSRPRDDREPHRASGEIGFDDIRLTAVDEPMQRRFQPLDQGAGEPHPLKVALELSHPAHFTATELRYAIYAPAPSALHFEVKVPESAVLSFGYGLTPAAYARAAKAPLSFEVEATTGDGATVALYQEKLPRSRARRGGWYDAEVDLERFAGQRITISLVTRGRAMKSSPSRELKRLPEAGMVWSQPRIQSRRNPGKTVVLLVFDTVSSKHTSLHGYERETTPHLAAIAKEGVSYRRAVTPSPWTLPSFASMLTGLEPAEHGAGERTPVNAEGRRPLAARALTIAERLRSAGWETRAWINNPYLTRSFGLHQGFSTFIDYGTRSAENASDAAVEDVIAHLSETRSQDRFFFVHLMDPHGPYLPNREFMERFLRRSREGRIRGRQGFDLFRAVVMHQLELDAEERAAYRELYDAVLAYADFQLGRIFQAFRTTEQPGRSLLLITADHGEEFWEHETYEHGHTLYDELLAVPLVVYAPGLAGAGGEVSEAVAVHDLAPTLLEFAGLEAPAQWRARSLFSRAAGCARRGDRALVASSLLYGIDRFAIERDGYKYIYNAAGTGSGSPRSPRPARNHELYDLREDPEEASDLFARELDRGLALHDELAGHVVRSLAGRYLLYFDAGSGAVDSELSGSLELALGATWERRVRDFLWPASDGASGSLSLGFGKGDSVVRFTVKAPRALLGFEVESGEAPVIVELKLNGSPVPASAISLGRSGAHPGGRPFVVPDTEEERLLPAEFTEKKLGRPAKGGPRVVMVRLGDGLASTDADSVPGPDGDLERQLKVLGYVD